MRTAGFLWVLLAATGNLRAADTTATRWWQGDLLDFSSDRARVVVNPILDLWAGNGCYENTRGARFEAVIDGDWEVTGSLEERQGVGNPLLSAWAEATSDATAGTVSLPGWGRAKWTNRSNYRAGDPIAFDASRATAHIQRSGRIGALTHRFETGLDHRHEGTGATSMFWNSTAAPLPFVGGSLEGPGWHVRTWAGSAIGPNRGPTGATAESLFSRQRVSRFGIGLHKGNTWSTDLLWYRLARLPFPGETRQTRHWGGAQATLRHGPWTAYLALACDPATAPFYLGEHLHLQRQGDRTVLSLEYQRSTPGGYRALPTHIDLSHSGAPLASPWGDGLATLTASAQIQFGKRTSCSARITALTQALHALESAQITSPKYVTQLIIHHRLQTAWPLAAFVGIQGIEWFSAFAEIREQPTAITGLFGLSHKFHSHPL